MKVQGDNHGYTRIFGGGDMAEVRKATININNCSVDEFRIFGGGYAEEAGRTTVTGDVDITISGHGLTYTWADYKNGLGGGDVVAGGYSKGQGVTSVEHTDILIKDGEMRSRVSGGGYAEKGGIAYVGSSNVLITDNAIMNGDGAGSRSDIFGGGYARDGGITQTGSSTLTITGGAEVRGQVYSGGSAYGEGSKTTVDNATVIVDKGFIKSTYRPMGGYNGEELRAGRLGGGIIATYKAEGGVGHGTVIFRNSVLEGARILGGSSAQEGSEVSDGTTNVYIESGEIKPSYDANKNRLRARTFHGGGDCWQGGTNHIDTANMYISGGKIQCNVFAGSNTEDDDFSFGRSYAMVENANLYINGGTFTMDYPEGFRDKFLTISAGGDAYNGPTSNVGNATLVIDGSSGNLIFDKGNSTNGFRILAGGLAEDTRSDCTENKDNWASTHVENSKVLIKNIDIVDGAIYTGGAAFTGYSTVKNSDLTLNNATVWYIDPFVEDWGKKGLAKGECSVENSKITLVKDAKITGKGVNWAIKVEAGKSLLAVDKSISEANVRNVKVLADERVLRLLDDVADFDLDMLDKWNYQGYKRDGDAVDTKLTRLEVMGKTTITDGITDDTIGGRTSALGGTGEAVGNVELESNTISLVGGTLSAKTISLKNSGGIIVDGGSLKTSSDQVFTTQLKKNDNELNLDPEGIKSGFTFNKGNLSLTDERYNRQYADKALSLINSGKASVTTSLSMLGTLVEVSENGNVDFDGGGDHGNHGSIEIDTKPGYGYGDTNHVHVHWKDQLGLLGGESTDTELITANNDGAIHLEVGNATDVQTLSAGDESKGLVTLGNEFHASKGTLSGTATVNTGAKLAVVENGEYLIDKVELVGAGAEADIRGKLTMASLSSKGGVVNVSGDASSTTMTAESSALNVSGKLEAGTLTATDSTMDVSGSVKAASMDASGSDVNVEGCIEAKDKLSANEGSITVAAGGEVKAGMLSAQSGSIEVSGKLTSSSVEASGSAMEIDGAVEAGKLVADASTVINVGSSTSAGRLQVSEADLNGAAVFLDPAWNDNPAKNIIENASHAVFGGKEVNGRLTAGQNSLLVLGDDSADAAIAAFKTSGCGWKSEVGAAIAIMKPQRLASTGSLLANGDLTTGSPAADKFAPAGDAIFKKDTLLIVDSSAASSDVALEGCGGKLSVEDGAKLYLHDAKPDTSYFILSGFDVMDIDGWKEEDLILNRLVAGEFVFKDGVWGIFTEKKDLSREYPGLIAVNAIGSLSPDSDSSFMGIRFLSRALDPTRVSDEAFVGTVNEVSRAAVTAGVQNTSLRIADAASNTVVDHMSLSQHGASSSVHAEGVDFWAAPLYGNLYTSGMNVAGSSVRGQFGGLALGADLEAGKFLGGKFRLGAAINGGGGQSETKGGVISTQNDYDFGGLHLYASWNKDALNVIGSVGYGFGNHEVEMGLPASMDMGSAKADIDTTMFTADLRAEYQLKTDWVDVLPHAGIRYTALKTDAHDLKVNGSVLNSVTSDTQNIVQFPIGVTLSKDFAFADWNVKPMADVSVIPAAGEKKASTKVNFSGLDAWDSVNSRIMDSTSWSGTVGVQAEKGKFTFGLNYGVQASSNETDQNVQVKLGWKF